MKMGQVLEPTVPSTTTYQQLIDNGFQNTLCSQLWKDAWYEYLSYHLDDMYPNLANTKDTVITYDLTWYDGRSAHLYWKKVLNTFVSHKHTQCIN